MVMMIQGVAKMVEIIDKVYNMEGVCDERK